MPKQSLLRIVKCWQKHAVLAHWTEVPRNTRGVYVLYRLEDESEFQVVYIGVAGLGASGGGGIRARLKSHAAKIKGWTHFSYFEVHDNVTREEIRELESLLLAIFRFDSRIQLENKQLGSRKLYKLKLKKTKRPSKSLGGGKN